MDRTALVALPLSLAASAAGDTLQLPWRELSDAFSGLAPLHTTAVLTAEMLLQFPFLVMTQVAIALILALAASVPLRVQRGGVVVGTLLAGGLVYLTLIDYAKFRGYPPFVVAILGLAILWALALYPVRAAKPWHRRLRGSASLLLLAAAGAAAFVNVRYFRGYYPTLHLALLAIIGMSTFAAIIGLLGGDAAPRRTLVGIGRRATAAVSVAVMVASLSALLFWPLSESLLPYVRSFSTLGQCRDTVLLQRPPAAEQGCAASQQQLSEERAEQVFRAYAHLDALPWDRDFSGSNMLIVVVEMIRIDHSSLTDTALATTPTLEQLEQRGAFVYTQARTPAPTTLQAISSLMTMRLTVDAPLVLGESNWNGRLLPQARTVAEAAREAGYATFHVMHAGVQHCCADSLSQGFEIRQFEGPSAAVPGPESFRHVDRRITDRAIANIDAIIAQDEKFFGWLFYTSPHAPLLARKPGKWSEIERYRQEIHNADKEFGRLVAHLQKSALLDNTVVVFTSDHGEQFGERGYTAHGNTVYAELKRVPLLIWVPGVRGRRVEATTSTGYVLPWLFLQAAPAMRATALESLRTSLAPMMLRTDGAVPVDLLRAYGEPWHVSLDDRGTSAQYEYHSERVSIFDLQQDPWERDNLYERGHPNRDQLVERLGRYASYVRCSQARRHTDPR